MPKFLNLGCGSSASFAPEWTNVDITPSSGIIGHNLYNSLPFEDNAFDAVYHSDAIEHLYKRFAPLFMREC